MSHPSRLTPQNISGLSEVIDQYDALLLDIWGTVHNGIELYRHVRECLDQLRIHKKKVCLLSNSPSRISSLKTKLESQFGVTPKDYTAIHNSGEAAYLALRDRPDEFHQKLGTKYFLIGLDIHKNNLVDLPYEETDFSHADFLYVSRTFDEDEQLSDFDAMLNEALDRKMPLLCANPDRAVGVGDILYMCSGALAEKYQQMGGEVFFHGKPYPSVYDTAFEFLGYPDKSRVLAIGDGLPTDIKGGADYGVDTLLLTDGIHREDHETNSAELFVLHQVVPTYTMPQLKW